MKRYSILSPKSNLLFMVDDDGKWVQFEEVKIKMHNKNTTIKDLEIKSKYWYNMWKECNEIKGMKNDNN